MQDLVGVGVADAGDGALVAQDALELLAAGVGEDAGEPLGGEVVGERVGAEAGDAGDVERVADQVERQGLLGAGLGDVETGGDAVALVEDDAHGERGLGAGARRQRGDLVLPAHPAGAREVEHQVQAAGLDVEELAVAADVVDEGALDGRERRVVGLERAEGGDVDAAEGTAVEPAPQVEGQRLDLGQLGHGPSVGGGADGWSERRRRTGLRPDSGRGQ
ncbi:hypothetical protein FQZ97_988030 [compost metagenome]